MNATPNFWLVLVIVLTMVFGSGVIFGHRIASNACVASQAKAQQTAQVQADITDTQREAVAQTREVSREQIRVVYRTIKEAADETIQQSKSPSVPLSQRGKDDGNFDCGLDADGLREWNAANDGSLKTLRGEPDYTLSSTASGHLGTSGRLVAEPHRGDGALHAVPRPAGQAGGLHVTPVNNVGLKPAYPPHQPVKKEPHHVCNVRFS